MDWWYWSKGECRDGMNLIYLSFDIHANKSSSSTSLKLYPLTPKNPNIRLSKKIMQRLRVSTEMSGRRLSASSLFSLQSFSNCQKTIWPMHTPIMTHQMTISAIWSITSELRMNGIELRLIRRVAIPILVVSLYSSLNMSQDCKSVHRKESGSM